EVDVDGASGPWLATPAVAKRLVKEESKGVWFLSFEDNLVHLHGSPAPLVDVIHHAIPVSSWGRAKATRLGDAAHLSLRPIAVNGAIAGFWEFDPERGDVAHRLFAKVPKADAEAAAAEAQSVAAFIRDEVGHGRAYALDS